MSSSLDYGVHSGFSFDLLPEELTERILSLCVSASLNPPPARPEWHTAPKLSASRTRYSVPITTQPRTRLSPLLVSKDFQRIGLPHYYSTIHISSPEQASALLKTLRENPHLGPLVRRICISGFFPGLGAIVKLCKNVHVLDLALDAGPTSAPGTSPMGPSVADSATEELCNALDGLQGIRHLTLRKPSNVYLTQGRVRYFITRLAATVERWIFLESVDVAFRMSDDTPVALLVSPLTFQGHAPSIPSPTFIPPPVPTPVSTNVPTHTGIPTPGAPPKRGPISQLTSALSRAPSLRVFSTHLPSLWNEAILCVSRNPSLQRIVLGDERTASVGGGVMPTGLYMTEAKKHPRLTELIKAGTPMVRTRAQTMGYFITGPSSRNGIVTGNGGPSITGTPAQAQTPKISTAGSCSAFSSSASASLSSYRYSS